MIAMLVAASGCAKKIRVESDTSWTGNVNGSSVDGAGNKTYDLSCDSDACCYTFQKDTESGSLTVRIVKGTGTDGSTRSPYGIVSGCVE